MRLRAAAVLSAAGATLVLSGCEKPVPGVSVFSGSHVARAEAVCWAREDGGTVSQEQCSTTTAASLGVAPGRTIGISVDKKVADAGWRPAIGTQYLVPRTLHDTYYRFAVGEQDLSAAGGLDLRVVAVDDEGANTRGLWVFKLERD